MSRENKLAMLGAMAAAVRAHELRLFDVVLRELPEGAVLTAEIQQIADEYTEKLQAICLRVDREAFSGETHGSTGACSDDA